LRETGKERQRKTKPISPVVRQKKGKPLRREKRGEKKTPKKKKPFRKGLGGKDKEAIVFSNDSKKKNLRAEKIGRKQ